MTEHASRGGLDAWLDATWLLDQLADAVIAADATATIRFANTAATKLLGFTADALVGLPLAAIVPERLRSRHTAGFDRLLETGQPRVAGGPAIRVAALRADGNEVDVEMTLVIDRVHDRDRLVSIAVLRDAGERVALEREINLARYLKASVDVAGRLQRAASVDEAYAEVLPALCANLDWDVAGIWHVEDGEVLTPRDTWHGGAAPLARFAQETRRVRLSAGIGLPGRCLERGEPVWVEDITLLDNFPRRDAAEAAGLHTGVAFPLLGGRGVLAVVELFSHDVRSVDEDLRSVLSTIGRQLGQFLERMQAESDLRYRAALLASQSEAMSDGMLVVSPTRQVLAYNRRMLELFDLTEDDVHVGAPTPVVIPAMAAKVVDFEAARAKIDHAHAHPDEIVVTEIELTDGRVLDVYGAPVIDVEGTYHGRAWYMRDITERRRAMHAMTALATTLQRSLLPPHVPDIPGLDLAWTYRAGGEGVEVGGDFYDVFPVAPGEWGLVIGDVCGKGAGPATVTALARYTARAEAMHAASPKQVLGMVNKALLREETEAPFLTAAYVALRQAGDGYLACVASAGHPLPLLLDASGHVETVGRAGTLLGVVHDIDVVETTRRLVPGDVLVLFTDGVTEARDSQGREFGSHRLAEVLRARRDAPAQAMVDAVGAALAAHLGASPRDDVAVLAVRVL